MGIRAPSFALVSEGTLAANAGLLTREYNRDQVTVTSADREIPTTTAWSDQIDGPDAHVLTMLRPAAGDWPLGPLNVVARGWGRVIAECQVTVGPAIDGPPPTCDFISGRIQLGARSYPGGGGCAASAGFGYAGLADACGPLVWFDVELTVEGDLHTYRRQRIGDARRGNGVIMLGSTFDEVKRISITNVIGKTLELLPPFPRGTAPAWWGTTPMI